MPDLNTTNTATPEKKKSRDGLALVLGGIFILGLVFATYTYFNKTTQRLNETNLSTEERDAVNNAGNITSAKTQREETNNNTGGAINVIKEIPTTMPIPAMWVANNYNRGDIIGSSYSVKRGDTLWEIAEAVYGDGSQWAKLLQANSSSVGFLPNGQQALIVLGQVLVIPTPQ